MRKKLIKIQSLSVKNYELKLNFIYLNKLFFISLKISQKSKRALEHLAYGYLIKTFRIKMILNKNYFIFYNIL
jgi:hypothetical protein